MLFQLLPGCCAGKQETAEEVVCQGNLLHEVQSFLKQEYGIGSQYMQVNDKRKG